MECRRGTLLLKESSVELLGGEVAELITQYSQASLLSGILNKEIPQGEYIIVFKDNVCKLQILRQWQYLVNLYGFFIIEKGEVSYSIFFK